MQKQLYMASQKRLTDQRITLRTEIGTIEEKPKTEKGLGLLLPKIPTLGLASSVILQTKVTRKSQKPSSTRSMTLRGQDVTTARGHERTWSIHGDVSIPGL